MKVPQRVKDLLSETKGETKKAAWNFFNKCDLADLQSNKICLVETERVESFLNYAKEKGVVPCGGAMSNDLKSQYFYV